MWRASRVLVVVLLAAAASARAAEDCITIENFAADAVGAFPAGWRVRKDSAKPGYTVLREGPLHFLRAHAENLGMQAAKEKTWDLDAYPVLAWSWRPRVFPSGANEQSGKNDSVLAVYLLVPYSRIVGPKAVKYVWSGTVPVGTRLSSNAGNTQVRVLRSSATPVATWTAERVNVRDDYRAYFEVKESPKPAGIAVLTDSDDTASVAEGDYADFRACRN